MMVSEGFPSALPEAEDGSRGLKRASSDEKRAATLDGDQLTPRVAFLEVQRVSKWFGGLCAVDDVSLKLQGGEVLGLLGHNGAGKSTLIKIISGVIPADSGRIVIGGEVAPIHTPHDARRRGIETIYQDLALLDNLDAAANLFLGREIRKRNRLRNDKAMAEEAARALRRVNPAFDNFKEPVRSLSGGQRQAIAIARALYFDARILILDEPTAALGPRETALFKELVLRVKSEGVGIILISHSIADVLELTDRLAVMAAGRLVGSARTADTTEDEILEMIIVGGSTTKAPPC